MAFHVEITPEAERDAQAIFDWLMSQYAGDAGIKWFLAMENSINSLAEYPERCALAPENLVFPLEVRQLLYGRKPHVYRILFTIENQTVYILHIRHGRRRPISPHSD